MNNPRQLSDFEGEWEISRTIDQAGQPTACFEGTACWTPREGGLICVEAGRLTVPGQPPMQAERRYLWAADLSVRFDDGRFFHTVPAAGGAVRHWCDPDRYDGFYDFTDWPAFTLRWQVCGPRKEYVMQTRYARAG